MASVLNWAESDTNPMFAIPFYWHYVLGSWAFGAVFMATDPVSSAFTKKGIRFSVKAEETGPVAMKTAPKAQLPST